MTLKTLLLHADDDDRLDARLSLSMTLARKHDAKIFAIFPLLPPPSTVIYAEYVPAQIIKMQIEGERERAEATRARIANRLDRERVAWEWRAIAGDGASVLASTGSVADLIVMSQDASDAVAPAVAAVTLAAGRPVLCLPHSGRVESCGRRILIAWNGSRESARAAHDALPFLREAERVVLFTMAEGQDDRASVMDAAAHLSAHGAKIDVVRTKPGGIDIGNAILNAAADSGADLIVMGAYGHTRIGEWIFGGATRTILQSMTVPTLLSH
jgi:nucleotide-binding universal stress UspA family protein